jgi:hypothetical protein
MSILLIAPPVGFPCHHLVSAVHVGWISQSHMIAHLNPQNTSVDRCFYNKSVMIAGCFCRHFIIVALVGWIFRNRMYVKKVFDDIIFKLTIERIERLGDQLCYLAIGIAVNVGIVWYAGHAKAWALKKILFLNLMVS